jgi:hypothetical protein
VDACSAGYGTVPGKRFLPRQQSKTPTSSRRKKHSYDAYYNQSVSHFTDNLPKNLHTYAEKFCCLASALPDWIRALNRYLACKNTRVPAMQAPAEHL